MAVNLDLECQEKKKFIVRLTGLAAGKIARFLFAVESSTMKRQSNFLSN
jgi:hypothetical protein